MSDGFGFYFEEAGRSRTQGAVASEEEHFEGSAAEQSVARELGQNSLDAVDSDGDGVVRMIFELREMETALIPDIDNLRHHLDAVVRATVGTKGHERMVRAAEVANGATVMVLRVGDYGTRGLVGSEDIDETTSPLVALTRGAGVSTNDGPRGGSFGIGSAVGPMSSELCTVLWTSLAKDKNEVVFAGYSRLATHRDDEGVHRQADGFYTRLSNTENFEYLRTPPAVGPFGIRTELGTDVYILGYRKAAEDPWLHNIRDSFVSNFFAAIHKGTLVVEGRTPHGDWILSTSTLGDVVKSLPDVLPFYRALHDPEPYVCEHPELGTLRLYVEVDDSLPRKLHTISMRRPLMRIERYRHNAVSAKYAAILDCSNDKANEMLRRLEPPLHDRWDPARADGGQRYVNALKRFIAEGLNAKVHLQVGEEVKIDALQRLLPSNLGLSAPNHGADAGQASAGEGSEEESSTIQGRPAGETAAFNPKRRSVSVTVVKPATSVGDQPTEKGMDVGGSGTRSGTGAGLPGVGSEGEGRSRLHAGTVRMRSWTDPVTRELVVVVRSEKPIVGDLTLAPLGPGGQIEEGYTLPIKRVLISDLTGQQLLEHSGNTIRDLDLNGDGMAVTLRIELERPHRYRLGVA